MNFILVGIKGCHYLYLNKLYTKRIPKFRINITKTTLFCEKVAITFDFLSYILDSIHNSVKYIIIHSIYLEPFIK